MRFLVHSENATYSADTKKFTVELDRRVANPSELSLVGASFSASTTDSYPLVVYLRSDWGQALSKRKHTVELKCEQHEDSSNVLGVLRRDATHPSQHIPFPRSQPLDGAHGGFLLYGRYLGA